MYYSAQEIKKHYLLLALICAMFLSISAVLQTYWGIDKASLNFSLLSNGEYWRLITGHLIHTDWHHYGMNMVGLSLCLVVFRDDLPAWHWVSSFLFIALFSSLAMYFTQVPYDRYLGFSDVLHGWILIGAAGIAYKEPRFAFLVYLLFWLKILEENYHFAFFTSYGMGENVARESHIFGAIGGMIYALFFIPTFGQALMQFIKKFAWSSTSKS